MPSYSNVNVVEAVFRDRRVSGTRIVESWVMRSALNGLPAASRTLVTRSALFNSKVATFRSSSAVKFTLARAVIL